MTALNHFKDTIVIKSWYISKVEPLEDLMAQFQNIVKPE